jgi:hypothetical protein
VPDRLKAELQTEMPRPGLVRVSGCATRIPASKRLLNAGRMAFMGKQLESA